MLDDIKFVTFCFVEICMDLVICVYPLGVFSLDIMYMLFLYVFFGLFIYVIASIVLQYSRLVG